MVQKQGVRNTTSPHEITSIYRQDTIREQNMMHLKSLFELEEPSEILILKSQIHPKILS